MQINAAPVVSSDGNSVFVGSAGNAMWGFNTADGTTRWTSESTSHDIETPAVLNSAEDTLFVASKSRRAFAFSTADGSTVWESDTFSTSDKVTAAGVKEYTQVRCCQLTGPALSGDGQTLFIGSGDDVVYALSTSDGALLSNTHSAGDQACLSSKGLYCLWLAVLL